MRLALGAAVEGWDASVLGMAICGVTMERSTAAGGLGIVST